MSFLTFFYHLLLLSFDLVSFLHLLLFSIFDNLSPMTDYLVCHPSLPFTPFSSSAARFPLLSLIFLSVCSTLKVSVLAFPFLCLCLFFVCVVPIQTIVSLNGSSEESNS
ncbi:uncharacterized protein LDX57_001221 [Aspergillus melleus]|uniref:uncharacterized protein n=1 Tax=Aspergillus melleus TaxID=138277 RepID=UPI001E8CE91D|nr:uncharacterized protein LDX57_001221 [Aspergillus melleus]KAH8423461.1 hypothetical protein LDX57_001221 [Aspergillus melleus]